MHIKLSKLEWIFDCYNVTLEAVNVQVSWRVLRPAHCSEDCPMWKVELYAMY